MATGKQWIARFRQRCILVSTARAILFSAAGSVLSVAFLSYATSIGMASLPVIFLLLLWLYWRFNPWNVSLQAVTSYIDLHFPEVEESSSLLLKQGGKLSFLEQLQARKVGEILAAMPQPRIPFNKLFTPAALLLISILVSITLSGKRVTTGTSILHSPPPESKLVVQAKENIPAGLSAVEVEISPPAYTGKGKTQQQQFSLRVAQGAQVRWKLRLKGTADRVSLRFNDQEELSLHAVDKEKTSWTAQKKLTVPGFYQLILDGTRSDFYQVVILPDLPVDIRILHPGQHSTVEAGQPQVLNLSLVLKDDYGITDSYMAATLASGKGEAVNFKQQKIPFSISFDRQKEIRLNKIIQLKDLGMKPGDELYFAVHATDNQGQHSKSDMYMISIQDTTALMSLSGIDNGVSLVPEYFRSERQLIIDTEKLLKEKSMLSDQEFKKRSNDLGIDQKMLRLRYGKFLGEEAEENIGGRHEEGHDAAGGNQVEEKSGDTHAIMDQYAHKHDNAEDATFFEPALKSQLKATLTEMWNAELRLRTYLPEQALPYEYKALRLLKDLQQKSRVYVPKTVVKTNALKPEKRLTGELSAITTGVNPGKFTGSRQQVILLRTAMGLLEKIKDKVQPAEAERAILLQAQEALFRAASADPGKFLRSAVAMKRLLAAGNPAAGLLETAQQGLSLLIGTVTPLPSMENSGSPSELTTSYFNQLKRNLP